MNKKKFHRLIDFILLTFPLWLIAFSVFRNGQLSFTSIENDFSIFRQMDFGLSNYILTNMFNNLNANALLLLMIDLMIYYLYWRFFDLVYGLFGFFIDIIKVLAEKWGGVERD